MIKSYLKKQTGATLVLTVAFILGLLGFTGLVVDVGNCYIEKARMQTAVDMAALSGANNLPDEITAKEVVTDIIHANHEDPPDSVIKIKSAEETTTAPAKLTVTLTKPIPTHLIRVFGISTVTLTVQGVASSREEASKYTIYSTSDLELHSGAVYGSVYSGGDLSYLADSGALVIYGDADAKGQVNLRDEQVQKYDAHNGYGGHKHPGVSKKMPTYTATSTPGYNIKSEGQGTITINLGSTQLEKGVSIETQKGQTIILDLGTCSSPKPIMISGEGNVEITGDAAHLTTTQENPLVIYGDCTGEVTIKFSSTLINASVYFPNGQVTMQSGSCNLNGCLVAKNIKFNVTGSFNITGPSGSSAYHRKSRLVE